MSAIDTRHSASPPTGQGNVMKASEPIANLMDILFQTGRDWEVNLSLDNPETIKIILSNVITSLMPSEPNVMEGTISSDFPELYDLYVLTIQEYVSESPVFGDYLNKLVESLMNHPSFTCHFSTSSSSLLVSNPVTAISLELIQDALKNCMQKIIRNGDCISAIGIIEENLFLKNALLSLVIIKMIWESKELKNAIRLTPSSILSIENAPDMIKPFAMFLIPLRNKIIELSDDETEILKFLCLNQSTESLEIPQNLLELKGTLMSISQFVHTMPEFAELSKAAALNEMEILSESSSTTSPV